MSNQLPMAIKSSPIPYSECNFVGFDLEGMHHPLLSKFIVETNHKVFGSDIVLMLGISHECCTNYIGGEQNYIKCQLPPNGVNGYLNCIWGITYDQLMMMWAKAKNARADKYKPILSELIMTQVLPLFNSVSAQIEVLPEASKPETMSSLEIAQLTGKRHDNVMRDIKDMLEQLNIDVLSFEDTYVHPQNKQTYPCYNLNEELTLTLTSGYSIPQRHAIIREWQAHRRGELIDYQPQTIPPTTPRLQIERPQTSKPHNAAFLQTTLKQIESMELSAESRQVLKAYLLHEQAGLPLELMLPVIRDEKLSPAQIALRMNVSAQAIGHIISKLGIRGNQNYSEARLSHSERSKKDVVVHFYNNQAVNMIQQALKDKQNEKKN